MNTAKVKYVVDMLLLTTFAIVFITGIIKFPDLRLHRLGFNMVQATTLHDWSGIAMGIIVFIHIALNWEFIVDMTKKLVGRA